jgi:cell division septum initiation protein DivIVA
MSTINPSSSDVSFRVRPLGFDRGEVQAFIGNLLNDYAQVTRELDRLRIEMAALREAPPEPRLAIPQAVAPAGPKGTAQAAASSAREVERILAAAERIAEDMRSRAQQDSDAALQESEARAAATVRDAEERAAAALHEASAKSADVLRDAEARAAEIVDSAAQQVVALDRQAAAIRTQCMQMREAIRSAGDAASQALRHIASLDDDHEPALQTERG